MCSRKYWHISTTNLRHFMWIFRGGFDECLDVFWDALRGWYVCIYYQWIFIIIASFWFIILSVPLYNCIFSPSKIKTIDRVNLPPFRISEHDCKQETLSARHLYLRHQLHFCLFKMRSNRNVFQWLFLRSDNTITDTPEGV